MYSHSFHSKFPDATFDSDKDQVPTEWIRFWRSHWHTEQCRNLCVIDPTSKTLRSSNIVVSFTDYNIRNKVHWM